jgi:hypothetical protein
MNFINLDLCRSVQNKNNIKLQCNNKPKNNEVLCGKHLNCKNLILFKEINDMIDLSADISDNLIINNKSIIENNESIKKDNSTNIIENEKKKIYSKEELFEIISTNKPINIYSLRKSIKNCGLNKIINTKQTKNILINLLKKVIIQERFYYSNQSFIILIQSVFRRWLIKRRKNCVNDTDILTFISKYDIPEKYFYIFYDNITKKKYGYDIRTLIQIIHSEYQSCPYTFRSFTDNEKNMINNYVNKLLLNGIDLNIEKKVLTFEEETEMKIKDVFYQINMLDNYTNHNWFKELSLFKLMELYLKMEDIWNYRSSMTMESKQKIVGNGIVFNIPPNIIKYQKSKLRLQNVILDEFLRMINEGINRDEKKLGAILILTGLVEVSHDAADALPHLVQI